MDEKRDVRVKVIGAGFGRTGTLSFKKALEILGFGPTYHMLEVGKNANLWTTFANNTDDLDLLHEILGGAGYQSTCDFPSSPYWKEQCKLYPEGKVVLTARDPEKWYKSCCDTIFKMMPGHPASPFGITLGYWIGLAPMAFRAMHRKVILHDSFNDDLSKENIIACYNRHNDNVIKTCPPEKLLVFDVSQGWAPLCAFLDVPIPDVPFPHVNDTAQFQSVVKRRCCSAYTYLMAGVSAAVMVGSVVVPAALKYVTRLK